MSVKNLSGYITRLCKKVFIGLERKNLGPSVTLVKTHASSLHDLSFFSALTLVSEYLLILRTKQKPAVKKRGRLTGEERKQAIALAAVPLFSTRGFTGTTTRELAAAAGVSEALLYRHFPGKESIYQYIQDQICQNNNRIGDYLTALSPSTESLVKMVYLLYRILFPLESKHSLGDAIPRMIAQSLMEDGEFTRSFHESRFARMLPLLADSAEAARESGDLITGPLSHEERQWFPHHLAVALRLSHLPAAEVFDYGSPADQRFEQALWFSLRGLGLTDQALDQYLDCEMLNKEILPILIEAGIFNGPGINKT